MLLNPRQIRIVESGIKRGAPIRKGPFPILGSRPPPTNIPPQPYEIFAYCSRNYEDAYYFVIDSWIKTNCSRITIYTDFDLTPTNSKVHIVKMFEPDSNWIVGTGRRLDVINHYIQENKTPFRRNLLFMDIDCYIVNDPGEVFNNTNFDIGITRLFSTEKHTNSTATAGLWFAKTTQGFYSFIQDWTTRAMKYKEMKRGVTEYRISYVQYSFTDVAREGLVNKKYNILPLEEKIYNSEHTQIKEWINIIHRYNPKILHFKGRRFRDSDIVNEVFKAAKH